MQFEPGSDSNTFYGYVYATPWQGITYQHPDGTIWGNSTTAGAFVLVQHIDGDGLEHWNAWFSGTGTGDYLAMVDFNIKRWSCAFVTSIEVNGNPMIYDSSSRSWKRAITVTDNTLLTFTGIGQLSDYSTGDGYAEPMSIDAYLPTGYTIGQAGTYTITLTLGEGTQYSCSIEEGDNTGIVMAPIPSELKIYDTGMSSVLATLSPEFGKTGVFKGQLEATVPWMNFKLKDEENGITYGTDPSDKTSLSSDDGCWNFWIDGERTGTYDIEVNLITMKWTHSIYTEVVVAEEKPITEDDLPIIPTNKPTTDVEVMDGPFEADYNSVSAWECPEWFRDAKFGIWAHWGPQCHAEDGDWYGRHMYIEGDPQNIWHKEHFGLPVNFGLKELCRDWKAQEWDPETLVNLYKSVGARYFMALANHHDNFDLWDSPYQEWNSVNLGPKKDLVKGWSDAARAAGLPFGVSIHASHAWTWLETSQDHDGTLTKEEGAGKWWDGLDPQELYAQNHERSAGWKNYNSAVGQWNWGSGANQPSEQYKQKFQNRTLQLINDYNPDMIYFDDTAMPFYGCDDQIGKNILAHYYNHSAAVGDGTPNVVVTGKQLNAEQKQYMLWDVERGIPDRIQEDPWQTCTCIGSWHYDIHRYLNDDYKSAQQVIDMLLDIVSKNGNLLLSIPVRSNGTIDDKEMAVLEGIKAWMDINGESVYGTRPWKTFGEGPLAENVNPIVDQGFNEGNDYSAQDVRYVQKDGYVYGTIMMWPSANSFTFKCLGSDSEYYNGEVKAVTLLGFGDVEFTQQASGVTVTLPATRSNEIAPVFKFDFSDPGAVTEVISIESDMAKQYFTITGFCLDKVPEQGIYIVKQGSKTWKEIAH